MTLKSLAKTLKYFKAKIAFIRQRNPVCMRCIYKGAFQDNGENFQAT